jgi:cystathionine beta-synthase
VLEERRLVGIIDESDLLLAAHRDPQSFDRPAREVMTSKVQTIDHRASIEDLFPILDAGLVAVVNDVDGFHGLITRVDVLNYLRKQRRQPKNG